MKSVCVKKDKNKKGKPKLIKKKINYKMNEIKRRERRKKR
ncbi:predicted protein [Listeria monocytogenes FSL R2-503]|nr:predicted protein [Listeria monocytogenes FSL R2-503]